MGVQVGAGLGNSKCLTPVHDINHHRISPMFRTMPRSAARRSSMPACRLVADGRSDRRRPGQQKELDVADGHQPPPDIADVLDDAAQCRQAELDAGESAGYRWALGSASARTTAGV
jgi:hypothetical protein